MLLLYDTAEYAFHWKIICMHLVFSAWLSGVDKYAGLHLKSKKGKKVRENVDPETCARRCFQRENCLAFDYNKKKKS